MKIIHAADIHLGAKMDSKFPKEISDRRKEELRNTFRRMVEYARQKDVRAILLSGDVFDSDTPFKKDKEFFYSVVRSTPEIDFFYLRGNHDTAISGSDNIENLKTFGSTWTSYAYGNIVITGIEISSENAVSMYSTLSLDPKACNIVMLHGQIGETAGRDKIAIKRLREKNIDYLALGHIHRRGEGKIDERGEYAYCGCLEGRGFDESGEHGFLLLDIEDGKVERTFVPFAERTIEEIEVDVSGVRDAYAAYRRVKEKISFDKKNIYRILLVGETDLETEAMDLDVRKYLEHDCFFVDVKDRTTKRMDASLFEGDLSLRGEFVRSVYADPALSDEEKQKIIAIGLKALKGGEVTL